MRILFNRAASVCLFLMVLGAFFGLTPAANASAGNNNVKIVAVYGAGNLSHSEYSRDTIILFNPTTSDINMAGWTIQTGGTTGAFTTIYNLYSLPLPGAQLTAPVIKAGGFFAIAGSGVAYISSTGCNTTHCNLADTNYDAQLAKVGTTPTTADNDLSSAAVVIALVSNGTSAGASCSVALASSNLVDVVGVGAMDGSVPNTCYAGGGYAPYVPNPTNAYTSTTYVHGTTYAFGTIRKSRCVDTFNNDADFTLGYIDFENAHSAVTKPCPTTPLNVTATAMPSNVALNGTFLLMAKVTPATGAASTNLSVVADLTSLSTSTAYTAPASTTMYDDGTHGDLVAGDDIYSVMVTAPSAYPPSKQGTVPGIQVTVTDAEGNLAVSSAPLGLGSNVPGPGNNNLEIVDFYGAGNLSGSQYARDTIILFNPTQGPIDTTGWSIQTGGATGTFTTVYDLPGATGAPNIIPAGGFYAIAGSGVNYISSSGCTSKNTASPCAPTVDAQGLPFAYDYQLKTVEGTATPTDNDLSSTAVTVALVNNQTALATCDFGNPHLVDLVGIGAFDGSSPVTCYAGTGSASYIPNTINGSPTSINGLVYPYATVRGNRCSNLFDNSKDFQSGYIAFESSKSTPEVCGQLANQLAVTGVATPSSVYVAQNFTIAAKVTPASNSSNVNVTIDLSNIGLSSSQQMYDDGTHGDAVAGDHVFSVTTADPARTFYGGQPGLNILATDAQGSKAGATVNLTVLGGSFTMTTPTLTQTVAAGGSVVYPITITGLNGYEGILGITCVGAPNPNTLGVPVSTECVPSPPEVTIGSPNGTYVLQLGIAAGTTFSATPLSRSLPLMLIGLFSIGLLTVGIWRRKHLPLAALVALVTLMTLPATGCGKNGGIGNTNAAPGTYTYTLTATDTQLASITNSITVTLIVQ